MSASKPDLSEREIIELQQLLSESSGPDLSFARGVFAAAAIAPSDVPPMEFLPMLLGENVRQATTLRRLLELLLRDFKTCAARLAQSVPVIPEVDDEVALESFSKGFVKVAQKDAIWTRDAQAFEATVPLMMFSGYVNPQAFARLVPSASETPEEYKNVHRGLLAADLNWLFGHFAALRKQRKSEQTGTTEGPGRNEPCPCTSGKKFKKCCGL